MLHTQTPSRVPHYTFRPTDHVTSVKVGFYSSFISDKSCKTYEVRIKHNVRVIFTLSRCKEKEENFMKRVNPGKLSKMEMRKGEEESMD